MRKINSIQMMRFENRILLTMRIEAIGCHVWFGVIDQKAFVCAYLFLDSSNECSSFYVWQIYYFKLRKMVNLNTLTDLGILMMN